MQQLLRQSELIAQRHLVSLASLINGAPSCNGLSPLSATSTFTRCVSDKALQFSKDRKKFEGDLAELRKQWAEEQQELAAKRATAEEKAALRRQAAKAQRAQIDAASRDALRQETLAKQQVERELRAQEKAQRLQRQEARADLLEAAREERRQMLVARSAGWVSPESLEERIKEALDNPVPLDLTMQPRSNVRPSFQ